MPSQFQSLPVGQRSTYNPNIGYSKLPDSVPQQLPAKHIASEQHQLYSPIRSPGPQHQHLAEQQIKRSFDQNQRRSQDGIRHRHPNVLSHSLSGPLMRAQHPALEIDVKDKERLRLMYPEPGLRETFVKGVIDRPSIKPVKPRHDGNTLRYNMDNPFLQGTLSNNKLSPSKLPMNFTESNPPSYGQIMGLSQRLDKSIRSRMRLQDNFATQKATMKLVNEAAIEKSRRAKFQQTALHMVNSK